MFIRVVVMQSMSLMKRLNVTSINVYSALITTRIVEDPPASKLVGNIISTPSNTRQISTSSVQSVGMVSEEVGQAQLRSDLQVDIDIPQLHTLIDFMTS